MSEFSTLLAKKLPPLPKLSELYEFLAAVDNYIFEPRPPHLMTIGTLTISYFLYHSYWTIFREKQRRRARSEMSSLNLAVSSRRSVAHGDGLTDREREAAERPQRSLLAKILYFDGIFDDTRSLDRILYFMWVPSIERGLAINKNRHTRRTSTSWHYSETYRLTSANVKKEYRPNEARMSNADFPPHLRYLIRLCRVFGHWTVNDVIRLHAHVTHESVPQGTNLFSIKESDDKIYIVLTGVLQLDFQDEEDGAFHVIKTLRSGDQIISLMSYIDFVMGKKGVYRTVQTQALTDSVVMKVPMAAIRDILCPDEHSLAHGLQRVLRRTYEVVFTACHRILGLTQELIRETPRLPLKNLEDVPLLQKPSQEICDQVAAALMAKLRLSESDRKLLDDCSVLTVPPGFVLFDPGTNDNKAVVYLFEGELEVSLRIPKPHHPSSSSGSITNIFKPFVKSHEMERIFYINAGEIFGSLVFLTDDIRQFLVKTSAKSIVVHIPETTLSNVLHINPMIIVPLLDSIFQRLSPFVRQMDFGIEWTYVESGQTLFKTNEESHTTYLVLNGRLRSFHHNNMTLVGEYGKYDFVGLVEMWTRHRRTKTVMAVRDTELAKIPHDFIFYICRRYANVAFQVLHYLTGRVVSSYKMSNDASSMLNIDDNFESTTSRCTFAIFPTSPDVPISYIAKEFAFQYEQFGTIILLNSENVKNHLGWDIFTGGNNAGITAWLSGLETRYRRVLYVADPTPTPWSVKCFHQADMIFIVVNDENHSRQLSEIETMILNGDSLAKVELIICHREDSSSSSSTPKQGRRTRLWLQNRTWLNFHHHVWVESRYYYLTRDHIINEMDFEKSKRNTDIARVVRWLTGNTFGLALGGGGAKGAAHIGFLGELLRNVLPIDMICGVSIGSFIGALYAAYQDINKVEKIAKSWFFQVSDGFKYSMDLTLPFVSFFKGDSLNHSLIDIFGDIQIEDLRIPFFICTTNLTNNSIREHRYGSLWRYVRASMTLINFFPPLCDPIDGHYLIDGGYMNLVPADIMRKMGVKYIMAVDISSKNNTYRNTNYGDSISGFNLLTHTLPLFSNVNVPSMMEIQSRLNWAQSVVYLNLVKKLEALRSNESPSIVYIRLPIDLQTTSEFKRFDKIRDIGSRFAKRVLANISPTDDVDVIWGKLRYNRGILRFGSVSSSFDAAIDEYIQFPFAYAHLRNSDGSKTGSDSETSSNSGELSAQISGGALQRSPSFNKEVRDSRRNSRESAADLNETSLNLYSAPLRSSR